MNKHEMQKLRRGDEVVMHNYPSYGPVKITGFSWSFPDLDTILGAWVNVNGTPVQLCAGDMRRAEGMRARYGDLGGFIACKNPAYDEMSVSNDGFRFTGLIGKRVVLQSLGNDGEPENIEVLNFGNARRARSIYMIQAEVSA